MKTKFLVVLTGIALLAVGCVKTVSGNHAAAMPVGKDKIHGRYERSVGQVYDAAKAVLKFNGVITAESNITSTNAVRALEGKVNQRRVWIRCEQIDSKITEVVVQARGPWGGSDMDLVHELEKEIALKL